MAKKPVTAIILGAGHRSMTYGEYSLEHPDELKIVGVAELDEYRRNTVKNKFGIPDDKCFVSAEALAAVPRFADVVINGTMDEQHVETSLPLLKCGYDMLLEKPFAVNETEMNVLVDTVKEYGNKVMICHVLRYTPFYRTIKENIINGTIGDVINIQTVENISYDHITTSYVRGKWADINRCRTTMLLAKCCHDIDIMAWLMGADKPVSVSSVGSLLQFKPENAPEGAGTRCLVDCPHVDSCRYSAKRIYLQHPESWQCYVWQAIENIENPTEEDRIATLKENDYGRCVYKCGNNVCDHQSVLVNFASGATGTHNVTGGAVRSLRTVRVTGTKGDMYGEFEKNQITLRVINPAPGKYHDETFIDLSHVGTEGHGGGDENLMKDFIKFTRGEEVSVSCTSIYDSVAGHKIIFRADESREKDGALVRIDL